MIGNTNDPATPLDSAKRLLHDMGDNAVLLEQSSYGHCSISSYSSCTWKVALDYLLEGKLPKAGTVCELDDTDYGDYFPHVEEVLSTKQIELKASLLALAGEINGRVGM